MKTQRFILAASMLLAIVLAISCSSGDDEGDSNSVDAFGLPTQVYMDDSKYRGNGDIIAVFDLDTLFVGKIQNGQVALDLPEELDIKYLREIPQPCDDEDVIFCEGALSYPNDLTSRYAALNALIPGKNCYYLRLYSKGKSNVEADFDYYSKAGRMEGTFTYMSEYNEGYTTNVTVDVNFSKGWNISWTTSNIAGNTINALLSTNATQSVKNSVKWEAFCRNAD
jgi:hypothetical protein